MEGRERLRVGIVDYLNAWPLAWGFLSGALENELEGVYLPPADVAGELAAGRLDVGLIPSIEVQRQEGLSVVPGLCVASSHEVQSVVLISRGPMEEIRRVALDRNSRTSAALVQILLRTRHGIAPTIETASPDAEEMLRRADAALIIGDPALAVDRAGYRVWDLAAEWRELTGLPFVFAVWAVRPEARRRAEELAHRFAWSLRLGERELDRIIDRARADLGLDEATVRRYLTESLSYRLDAEALAGLREFYGRAAELGLLETVSELDFLGLPPTGELA